MDDLRIQMVDDVIEYFLKSDAFQAVKSTEAAFDQPAHKRLLDAYNTAKETYMETKKYGRHHPDLPAAQKAFQAAKSTLFDAPFMKAYLAAYQTLQTELDAFSQALAKTISPQISLGNLNVRL